MAKLDVRHAFRLCPVRPDQCHLLGYRWGGWYFVDTRLPFGGRSSPYAFNSVASLLCWVFCSVGGVLAIIHYLDDYFLVNRTEECCGHDMRVVRGLCADLGVPLAPDKIVGPSQRITYLGIEIDTVEQCMRLPKDKLEKLLSRLVAISERTTVTKVELLSVIGLLSFACKVVRPGRIFLRRLIDLSTTVTSLHHHIKLSVDARLDLAWWLQFVREWNGVGYIPSSPISSPDLDLYTDASDRGFGCVYNDHWALGTWPTGWADTSINAREAFAIWVAVRLWGENWGHGHIVIHTDSEVNTHTWKTGSCRDKDVMRVIRALFLFSARRHLNVTMVHISGCHNIAADFLSRFKVQEFRMAYPQADEFPTRVPDSVWDI